MFPTLSFTPLLLSDDFAILQSIIGRQINANYHNTSTRFATLFFYDRSHSSNSVKVDRVQMEWFDIGYVDNETKVSFNHDSLDYDDPARH